ncbi:TPA: hypothetical protein ACSP1Y_004756 [Aeromonas hydrophila]|uniref:hypothetical protein n=1 Tax=Aeromonas salmonicida TaxID=645 RepID=UPI000F771D6C|nr:hypothetical protein [Aeromonas salmonicida]
MTLDDYKELMRWVDVLTGTRPLSMKQILTPPSGWPNSLSQVCIKYKDRFVSLNKDTPEYLTGVADGTRYAYKNSEYQKAFNALLVNIAQEELNALSEEDQFTYMLVAGYPE